ncbi:hypothetical protein L7F22_006196 [Adiantum nelumboides]|nr:hypothetical protein [Adiantum nelumboides]MCO5552680.1 hypothetical protein [Adiantum nelumboides]
MALWNAAARSGSVALRLFCSAKGLTSNAAILDSQSELANHGSHCRTPPLPSKRRSSSFSISQKVGFSTASVAASQQQRSTKVGAALSCSGHETTSICMGYLGSTAKFAGYSTAAMASAPFSSSAEYIPGRADPEGTASYARKIGAVAAPGHFRSFRLGGNVGDLVVSSIGMGTFGGSDTDAVDREYIESLTRGLTLGVNLIDCASNYRNMRSELAVGKCLTMAFKQGILNRNEVIVCSKGGFLSFDYREDIDPYTYIDNKYIHTNLFTREEFVGGCHCLSPNFLKNQVEVSRRNMGLDVIDIYFVHNPETQLNVVPKNTLYNRIKGAFQAMEECCDAGKISAYGVATWSAFRVNQSGKQYVPLEELVNYAREIAGENHHFKVVQAPFNGKLQEAANQPTQTVRGKRMPLLHAAHHLGLSVIASSSMDQGHLCKNLNPDIRNKCPEIGEQRTDGQCALQFVRTTPGVMSALVCMRSGIHVEENAALIRVPAAARS